MSKQNVDEEESLEEPVKDNVTKSMELAGVCIVLKLFSFRCIMIIL